MIGESGGAPTIVPFTPANDSSTTVAPYTGYDIDGGAANDVLGVFYIPFKCKIKQCQLNILEQFDVSTTAPVFYFDKSTKGTVPTEDGDVAIMTVADETAIGKCLYQNPSGIEADAGDMIVVSLQTDGADGSAIQGMLLPALLVEYIPEVEGNITEMTNVTA